MLLDFATVVIWSYAAFFAFVFVSGCWFAAGLDGGFDNARQKRGWALSLLLAIPAWAWLIARYWM